MNQQKQIAVIGAGISGLSAAYWLQRQGHAVTVFEKALRYGGSIVTEKKDGFLIDYGPNSTLETSDVLRDLVRDLGLEEEKVYANAAAAKRYVVKQGTLHALPMSPSKFLTTQLFSTGAKLRLLREPFIPPSQDPEISLADLVRYRLGKEFLDYAINPFVAGVYAGNPETLSAAAAFPKLVALEQEYGSFIKGSLLGARARKQRKEVAKDRARLFSFADGMQTLPAALADQLGDRLILGAEIKKLCQEQNGFVLEGAGNAPSQSRFDQVILATPAPTLAQLLHSLAPEAAAQIAQISYSPVAVVFMGFKAADVSRPLDGFGFLVPAVEQRQILGSIWSSTIFPGRAPDGYAAFTTFVGGARQPDLVDLPDEQLQQRVYADLQALVGLRGAPVCVQMRRWPRAIPQYTIGYRKFQQLFTDLEKAVPGLYFAGNFRRGISVGDSVLCAHETVQKMRVTGGEGRG